LIAGAGVLLSPISLIPHVGAMGYMIVGHAIMLGSLFWVVVDTFRYLRKF